MMYGLQTWPCLPVPDFSEHHTITHNKDYKIATHNLEENLMYSINNNKMYT